jgi:hypothetical protein
MNYSFYVHSYEDSSYFSVQIMYMYFHFRQKRLDYVSFLGNLYFKLIYSFNFNIQPSLIKFINSFCNFSFYNLFFYKFIFLFFEFLRNYPSVISVNLDYFYLFLQTFSFKFLSSKNLFNSNKFVFYFSLLFLKRKKFNNNFLFNFDLIKSFFFLSKSFTHLKKNNKLLPKTFTQV